MNEEQEVTQRFEDEFCAYTIHPNGIHQIGIVDPYKRKLIKFTMREINRVRNEKNNN